MSKDKWVFLLVPLEFHPCDENSYASQTSLTLNTKHKGGLEDIEIS